MRPSRQRPLTVLLDATEKCNLKCTMCYFSATDRLRWEPFDRELSPDGMMPLEVFEKIAADLFPRAWRVALACAAEPLIHPRFIEMVGIAGRYRVPDLWFPTNLLALTEKKAQAIVDAEVTTVGVSIDGTRQETYEAIRIGGKWARLMKVLDLFNQTREERRAKTGLRIIFTWMKTNRGDLLQLPEFAERHGANEIDVRFVVPTAGVDVSDEVLDGEDPSRLRDELGTAAEDAVRRGLRLSSYPEYDSAEEMSGPLARLRRQWFRRRAGLDRWEYTHYRMRERLKGCVWPGDFYVVRPNGAVSPCIFWNQEPIGYYPDDSFAELSQGPRLTAILDGLRSGRPVGTCQSCSQRKNALYVRLKRLVGRGDSGDLAEARGSGSGSSDLVQL
ncbi:MAG: radical SAM/SPASM domain-containing protein [Acidobacteria bacterium]|nr:MAG: radical SAM/SPASM domain-containing protein [Acidobacteriota bacterium]